MFQPENLNPILVRPPLLVARVMSVYWVLFWEAGAVPPSAPLPSYLMTYVAGGTACPLATAGLEMPSLSTAATEVLP